VMIGRGALANPWIFSKLNREEVTPEQVRETVRKHLAKSVEFYGEEDGQRLFRKYAVQYLLMKTLTRETRKQILKPMPPAEFLEVLETIYTITET